MPLNEEVKKIVDEAETKCPICGQKVVAESRVIQSMDGICAVNVRFAVG